MIENKEINYSSFNTECMQIGSQNIKNYVNYNDIFIGILKNNIQILILNKKIIDQIVSKILCLNTNMQLVKTKNKYYFLINKDIKLLNINLI